MSSIIPFPFLSALIFGFFKVKKLDKSPWYTVFNKMINMNYGFLGFCGGGGLGEDGLQ